MAEPLIDLRLLRLRAVLATNVATFLIGFAMFAAFALIPRFVQAPESTGYGFGDSVTTAGLILLPSAIIQLVVGPGRGPPRARASASASRSSRAAVAAVVSFVMLPSCARHAVGAARRGDLPRRGRRVRLRVDGEPHRRRPCRSPTSASRPASTRSCAPPAGRSGPPPSRRSSPAARPAHDGLPTEARLHRRVRRLGRRGAAGGARRDVRAAPSAEPARVPAPARRRVVRPGAQAQLQARAAGRAQAAAPSPRRGRARSPARGPSRRGPARRRRGPSGRRGARGSSSGSPAPSSSTADDRVVALASRARR